MDYNFNKQRNESHKLFLKKKEKIYWYFVFKYINKIIIRKHNSCEMLQQDPLGQFQHKGTFAIFVLFTEHTEQYAGLLSSGQIAQLLAQLMHCYYAVDQVVPSQQMPHSG